MPPSLSARRAWIEIDHLLRGSHANIASLSARRAWIEILIMLQHSPISEVALRKESVDRNFIVVALRHIHGVALRKESVDRNPGVGGSGPGPGGRSPQGERG